MTPILYGTTDGISAEKPLHDQPQLDAVLTGTHATIEKALPLKMAQNGVPQGPGGHHG